MGWQSQLLGSNILLSEIFRLLLTVPLMACGQCRSGFCAAARIGGQLRFSRQKRKNNPGRAKTENGHENRGGQPPGANLLSPGRLPAAPQPQQSEEQDHAAACRAVQQPGAKSRAAVAHGLPPAVRVALVALPAARLLLASAIISCMRSSSSLPIC